LSSKIKNLVGYVAALVHPRASTEALQSRLEMNTCPARRRDSIPSTFEAASAVSTLSRISNHRRAAPASKAPHPYVSYTERRKVDTSPDNWLCGKQGSGSCISVGKSPCVKQRKARTDRPWAPAGPQRLRASGTLSASGVAAEWRKFPSHKQCWFRVGERLRQLPNRSSAISRAQPTPHKVRIPQPPS
jgi:hypothetical protein